MDQYEIGKTDKREQLKHDGGTYTLASPAYAEDIALRIVK